MPTIDEDLDDNGDPSDDDANMNGIPDYLDEDNLPVDSDADGIPDEQECSAMEACADADQHGVPDNLDDYDDGDGLTTEQEQEQAAVYGADIDDDGVPNDLDAGQRRRRPG